jgi:hypothetical protein
VYWLQLPGVASYRISDDGTSVAAIPDRRARPETIHDYYNRYVVPMALQALGCEALHASGIVSRRGVVAFCGQPQAGKSTTAYALRLRGYPQWADDSVVLAISGDGVKAVALPFRVRMRPASAEHFSFPRTAGILEGPAQIRPADTQVSLAVVCILNRQQEGDSKSVEVRRLRPAEAFHALLPHATCFNLSDQERKRKMLEQYFALARRVPVFGIGFAPGLEHLDDLADAIEDVIGGLAGEAR